MVFAGEKHGEHGHSVGSSVGGEPVDRATEGDVAQTCLLVFGVGAASISPRGSSVASSSAMVP